jgi:predicted ATP-grasp superfamily ATP-dependent carboligase
MSGKSRLRILVTDGGNANTLGIVRQLGILQRFHISIIASNNLAPAKYSKYCDKFFKIAKSSAPDFHQQVSNIVKSEKIDAILPVGFNSFKFFVHNRQFFENSTYICLPPTESFEIATSKIKTTSLAEQLGLKVPKSIVVTDISALDEIANLRFPVVIKSQNEIGGRMVEYANSISELRSKFKLLVKKHSLSPSQYPLIQEYIKGAGVGYLAYLEDGVVKHFFMHRRVREFPVSGGRSVCAESFFDQKLKDAGEKILSALKWNGCAMVEFKQTNDNDYYILEINPKLWGSLELSICAGVNFPLYMLPRQEQVAEGAHPYLKNLRFQWLINGELYHLVNRPSSAIDIFRTAARSKKDFWISDLKPNLIQLILVFLDLYKFLKARVFA